MPVRSRGSPTGSQKGLIPLVLMEPVERHQPSPPDYVFFLLLCWLVPSFWDPASHFAPDSQTGRKARAHSAFVVSQRLPGSASHKFLSG